ncbi:MAG TPA: molybdopterin molybdotransferase MoeA, partial [Planctomycetota bacterium]|nr:molybdopterin molybdotransferase MoeA [Planctomycetota bacterium]
MTRDIRMKGFTGTTSLEEALAVIRDRVKPLPPEEIALDGAVGRVVASDVRSAVDIPAFARSAVDGYACRAEDTFGAGPFDAIELKVAFEVLAGKKPPRPLGRGEAARVMTGAPVPDGSDSVVMFEHVEARDASIRLVQALPPGKNVITRGEDVKKDEVVAPRGRRVRADDLGLLTSIRAGTLRVHRRPTIIIYSSGNELVRADSATQGDVEIVDSNGPMLAALALHEGIAATRGGIL